MGKILLHAREGVVFDHELVVRDSNGAVVDISGWTFVLPLQRQAGSVDIELGMASGGAEGMEVVDGPNGVLRVVVATTSLEAIDDTTGNFNMWGDLRGTAPGGREKFVADVRFGVSSPGTAYEGSTYEVILEAVGAAIFLRAEAEANRAETNAGFAEEFSGTSFPTIAEGEAETPIGKFFRVPIGTTPETYTRYQRTAGGSMEAAPLASTADLGSTAAGKGARIVAGAGMRFTSRAAIKALSNPADLTRPVQLVEGPRSGPFVFLTAAEYLAKYGRSLELAIVSDPDEGIHLAPDFDPSGASGAWVRAVESITKVVPYWWDAYGNKVDDDAAAIQAASNYLTALNAFDPFVTGTLDLRSSTYRTTSAKLLFENHSVIGDNAMLLSDGNQPIMEPRGNNLQFQGFRVWYTNQTSNAAREAIQLCTVAGKQTSKSTFTNIITRNAYRGWTAISSGGSCWGNVFINCRSDNNYDYAAYFDFPIGTTTCTFINWHSKGLLGAGNPKGMYAKNCQEVVSSNMAADQITGGLALEVINAQSTVIDLLTLESCQITTPDGALVSVNGGVLELGRIVSKVGLYQPGANQTCQILALGSTTRLAKLGDIETIQDQAGANGTLKKLKLNDKTLVKAQSIALADVNTQGNDKLFHNDDIQGYAANFATLPAPGVAGRTILNSTPGVGKPLGWRDTGTEWYGMEEGAPPITSAELQAIGNAVNITGKFYGRKYYNTTTGQIVHAQGTTAGATWRSANGNVHTPT